MATAVIAQHPRPDMAGEVRAGLLRPGQKELPSKYLYDEVGSGAVRSDLSTLPEYGLTRADERLMRRHAADIVSCLKPQVLVAELGSGSGKKTRWLLEALARRQCTTYCPIEISPTALARCEMSWAGSNASASSDLSGPISTACWLPRPGATENDHVLVLFLGSTIGNFDRGAAERFLTEVRRILFPGDALLLGTDLEKPLPQLLAAYDDPIGVTAAFNLNLLARINRELGADFDLSAFCHEARYNADHQRVEMHLRLVARIRWSQFPARRARSSFSKDETIWTESSHKYRAEEISAMARRNGFRCDAQWIDYQWPFAESLLAAE